MGTDDLFLWRGVEAVRQSVEPDVAIEAAGSSVLPWFGHPVDGRAWVRVANTLLDRIVRGEYSGRLPGRAALVAEFDVAARTIQHAISELAGRGVVYRVPGLSYHITDADRHGDGQRLGVSEGSKSGDPRAWVQVADAIRGRIACGDLKPWDLVPSREVLCREFRCSRSPVTRALTALERTGIIRRVPGIGYQVQGGETDIDTPRSAVVQTTMLTANGTAARVIPQTSSDGMPRP